MLSTRIRIGSVYKHKHVLHIDKLFKTGKITKSEKDEYMKILSRFKGNTIDQKILKKYIKPVTKSKKNNNIIKQAFVGSGFDVFFKGKLLNKYNLTTYKNNHEPCLFYGISKNSIEAIKKHKNFKIIVFCGSDIKLHYKDLDMLSKLKNVRFIAISNFIENKLKIFNINPVRVPISPTINKDLSKYNPVIKGKSIFIYTGLESRLDIYGFRIWKKLIVDFPNINFIIATNPICYKNSKDKTVNINSKIIKVKTFTSYTDLLENAYKKCFLGLRLTSNDGNSATVHELGLLGIKSIHNGCQPCAINYKTYEEIKDIIKREMETIGTVDYETYNKMIEFTNLDKDKWLELNYYI